MKIYNKNDNIIIKMSEEEATNVVEDILDLNEGWKKKPF